MPQTVSGTVERMALMHLENGKQGFVNNNTCHYQTSNYAYGTARSNDIIVFLGEGQRVYHTIVVDQRNNVKFDINGNTSGIYDGESYTTHRGTMDRLGELSVNRFKNFIQAHTNKWT